MKYSIHRCLAELKLLDSRITKATYDLTSIGQIKNSSKTEYATRLNEEDFKNAAKSKYDSLKTMIERRAFIKEAIVNSNANTIITIADKQYTVATAIEKKSSIHYEEELLSLLRTQYNRILADVKRKNDEMERNLDNQISSMLGGDSAKNSDNISSFAEAYRKQNGWEVLDPLNIKEIIDKMDLDINNFKNEIDYVLSTSNAITEIEMPE